MNDSTAIALVIAGVSLCATANHFFRASARNRASTPKKDEKRENLLLSDASGVWTDKVIPLAEACKIWVEPEEVKESSIPRPSFDRDAIDDFYTNYVEKRAYIHGTRKTVITKLLKMLDRDGECPSVVRNKKHADAENKYEEDVFSLLAEVQLWEHSLAVAQQMIQRVGRETLIPDAMIAALAHDIGKIPAYHDKGYTTGDHPIISAIVLGGISEFAQLSSRDEIEKTVRNHHSMKPANTMAALLKTCDQLVRNQEISQKLELSVAASRKLISTATPSEPEQVAPLPPTALPQQAVDPDVTRDHPMGHAAPGGASDNVRVELPWLSLEALLTELLSWINVLSKDRWGAVSMPDGIVYVNHDCLWGVLKKIAPANPELLTADADESKKRNILFSVVWTLSEQRNAIAAEMIQPGYYMIPVNIITGTGKKVAGSPLLIPFKAEAFRVLPSELEKLKSPVLWRMVKIIKPSAKSETT